MLPPSPPPQQQRLRRRRSSVFFASQPNPNAAHRWKRNNYYNALLQTQGHPDDEMATIVLPEWIRHDVEADGQQTRRGTIFSVHVHPDGSRVATAGLDSKIRIWSTSPIQGEESEHEDKLLCTLARHTGSVLVVRWSASGRFLASGSDDTISLIWDLDPSGLSGGAGFGAAPSEVNLEAWRPHRRLAGHESDVVDLAWSHDPEDSYLATVGLDSCVMVWSGVREGGGSFERIRRIDGHGGFVKGVVFDPIGRYLATASDDKTVRVWRVQDWQEEVAIRAPFETSPSTNFFARPSWSPDGAHLLCANAMSGPVFVASVVSRKDWSSDIHLVGHENSVTCTAFSPRLFRSRDHTGQAPATVLALGSSDNSVSVWITGSSRPLLVAQDVFNRQVMDLSWSSDGLTLYASSADGRIAAFVFTEAFLAPRASDQVLADARAIYGWRGTQRSIAQLPNPSQSQGGPNALAVRRAAKPTPHSSAAPARLKQNITKDATGRRRIQPTLLSGNSQSVLLTTSIEPALLNGDTSMNAHASPSRAHQQQQQQHRQQQPHSARGSYADVEMGDPLDRAMGTGPVGFSNSPDPMGASKRKIGEVDDAMPVSPVKGRRDVGRTLGAESSRGPAGPSVPIQQLPGGQMFASAPAALSLPLPVMLSVYRREEANVAVEARNAVGLGYSQVTQLVDSNHVVWFDVTPAPVLLATISATFSAVALANGSVIVYSAKGRRLMSMQLDAPVFRLESSRDILVAITTNGELRRWDVRRDRELHRPVSTQAVLGFGDGDLHRFWVHTNGAPILVLKSEGAFTLDANKLAWVQISSGWWADASQYWESRGRGRGASLNGGSAAALEAAAAAVAREPVKAVEAEINDLVVARSMVGRAPQVVLPSHETGGGEVRLACSLRHLETRMLAATLLDSAQEYRTALNQYARKLADEGIRNQAEDLLKSLVGPVYYRPGAQEDWQPTLLGLQKRDLMGEVLKTMGKSRLLLNLVQTYQETLRFVSANNS